MNKFVKLSSVAIALTAISSTGFAATNSTAQLSREIAQLQQQTIALQAQVRTLRQQQMMQKNRRMARKDGRQDNKKGLRFHGISVATSPYVGLRSSQAGDDQLVNAPSMSEDLYLIKQRDALKVSHKYSYPDSPMIELSGDLLGGVTFGKTDSLSLSGADLHLEALASPWALGFMSLSYTDGSNYYTTSTTVPNNIINASKIYLDRGFVTIGNLQKAPVYGSFGQMYVPFGVYSSYLVTDPVTKTFGRTNSPAALLGFYSHGVNVSGYAFQGTNKMRHNTNGISRFGLNAATDFATKFGDQKFGAGYISTITDSRGLNNTQVFAADTSATATVDRAVPAVDVYTHLNFNKFSAIAEYIFTTDSFNSADLASSNNSIVGSGKPQLLDLEAGYNFPVHDWSSNFYLDYEHTANSAYLGLPRDSVAGVFNTSPFKNTVLSAELRHDMAYDAAKRSTNQNAKRTGTTASLQAALYF